MLRPALVLGSVLALGITSISPSLADRWFGSITVACDSFAFCIAAPEMPDPPADSAFVQLQRSGTANAPVEMSVRVNRPVEGGVAIQFEFGQARFALQPGVDVLTRRVTTGGDERLSGYWIAERRVPELLAAMRQATSGRLTIAIAGREQERLMRLDGLDDALRFFDERQGRAGARDALIDRGTREPADAAAPKVLPAKQAWPRQIARIFAREQCEDRLATFDELAAGSVATPAAGRELWQIACAGGNYNVHFILVEVRDGDPRTARVLSLPTRLRKRPDGVATNPVWWDARKEIWAFERGRAAGDCGTVARYRWTPRGLTLADERRKEACDGKFADPWTSWPVARSSGRRRRVRRRASPDRTAR